MKLGSSLVWKPKHLKNLSIGTAPIYLPFFSFCLYFNNFCIFEIIKRDFSEKLMEKRATFSKLVV